MGSHLTISGLTEDHLRALDTFTYLSGLKDPHVIHLILLDTEPRLLPEKAVICNEMIVILLK